MNTPISYSSTIISKLGSFPGILVPRKVSLMYTIYTLCGILSLVATDWILVHLSNFALLLITVHTLHSAVHTVLISFSHFTQDLYFLLGLFNFISAFKKMLLEDGKLVQISDNFCYIIW